MKFIVFMIIVVARSSSAAIFSNKEIVSLPSSLDSLQEVNPSANAPRALTEKRIFLRSIVSDYKSKLKKLISLFNIQIDYNIRRDKGLIYAIISFVF